MAKKSIKRNPVKRSRLAKTEKAIELYRRFRGVEPEFIDKVNAPSFDVGMLVGMCDGILYTTERDGETESYIHEFTNESRPLLIASWDGKQIALLGGKYNFTDEGIKDYG